MLKKTGMVGYVALILLIIGGLNWGLVGVFGFDLVAALLGAGTMLARVVYIVVGLAAIYALLYALKGCGKCDSKSDST